MLLPNTVSPCPSSLFLFHPEYLSHLTKISRIPPACLCKCPNSCKHVKKNKPAKASRCAVYIVMFLCSSLQRLIHDTQHPERTSGHQALPEGAGEEPSTRATAQPVHPLTLLPQRNTVCCLLSQPVSTIIVGETRYL